MPIDFAAERLRLSTAIAEQQKQYDALDAKEALCASLPMSPDKFFRQGNGENWITYQVGNLQEALKIVSAYAQTSRLKTVSARDDGCLSIKPVGEHVGSYANAKQRWEISECLALVQRSGSGFQTSELEFFTSSPTEDKLKIIIELKQLPHQLKASKSCNYDRHGDIHSATLIKPDDLTNTALQTISFGAHRSDSCDFRAYFSGAEKLQELADKYHPRAVEAAPDVSSSPSL